MVPNATVPRPTTRPTIDRRGLLAAAGWLGGALLMGTAPACLRRDLAPLRIGLPLWPPYELGFLARDMGHYRDVPVALVEYGSPADAVRDFRSGALDAVALTSDYVFDLVQLDPGHKAVLAIDFSNGGDVLLAAPPIARVADLRGRRVGVEPSELGAHILLRALESARVSLPELQLVRVDVAAQEHAFLHRQIDAVVTYEPTRSRLIAAGANVLFSSAQIPGEIADLLLASARARSAAATTLRGFLKGWFAALVHLRSQPRDAFARMAPREQLTPAQLAQTFRGVVLLDLPANRRLLSGEDVSLVRALDISARLMREAGLLKTEVRPRSVLDDSFVRSLGR